MRRLTDEEMDELRRVARQGQRGPSRALSALWVLIDDEIARSDESGRVGSPRGGWAQDYSIARDQADELLAAMTNNRRLPAKVVGLFHRLWAQYSPSDYD
jgi:hypothetical protein